MKRSEINGLIRDATRCLVARGWALPPEPRWDVTDFGLGEWRRFGLVLINLAEEPEYCEKLMYAKQGMETPAHHHRKKKEDIICRWGELEIALWPPNDSGPSDSGLLQVQINGVMRSLSAGDRILLKAGERVTLVPGLWHAFVPASEECVIGEVSTANDDLHDNFFADPNVGRFPGIEEDEAPLVKLLSETLSGA